MDRFLPYIAGGVAFAKYDVDNTVGGTTSRMFDKTVTGWTVGAGIDYAFTDNLIGRAEYRYTDFGTARADEGVFDPFDADLSTNEVRLGLAYKF
ncbi:outer membrane beta-barrel protein [Mesorhizobium australicum]|uniref:Outer membrane beta-barrel protein n=1 Tax=Mesorhizobium australicum TaxID=536018 RepID=A0ACC6T0H4_9HYPH